MQHSFLKHALVVGVLAVLLPACDREADTPAAPQATTSIPPGGASEGDRGATGPDEDLPAPELKDVVEVESDYVVGITYPHSANQYPGLARELERYASAERAELMEAVQARRRSGAEDGSLYDLSLTFTEVLNQPGLVAYAADGTRYTGGAHGTPLLERFVWLPREDRMLGARDLVPKPEGWQEISNYVREQLHTALSQRVDADDLPAEDRARLVANAGLMIDEGTAPEPENFSRFEPMAGDGETLTGLRFVFPPYQVGPYSDGTQQVEVPASVLLPHIAPAYRGLFGAAAG